MGLLYKNLDARTREEITRELTSYAAKGDVYRSPRLSAVGSARWVELLAEAVASFDDAWLARQLRQGGMLNSHEQGMRKGKAYVKAVPVSAPETLAEGEFNRWYIRGLCARAIAEGLEHVVVYRGRISDHPRPESEAMIGRRINPSALLQDLRASQGKEPGLLPDVNSGLTVALP